MVHVTARLIVAALVVSATVVAVPSFAAPLGTAITYQGRLDEAGAPANGSYDLEFLLFDAAMDGVQIGATLVAEDLAVSDGLFTVDLDFGPDIFQGSERWLEITVNGQALSPRQPLTAAPYALHSLGPWQTSGADLFYTAGKVGIGTSTPGTSLQVAGGIRAKSGIPSSGNDGYAFDTDSSTGLFSHDSGAVQLWTNSSARITIDNIGRVGIGLVGPSNKLSVNGIADFGGIAIGLPTTAMQLQLSENSAAKPTSNTWTIVSDARLKKNIAPIEGALDQLMQLRGVTYQWIDPVSQGDMDGIYTGMIAQEVERVFPEWISEDKDGFKHLTVIGFEGLVVEALRDLQAEKDAEIQALRVENDQLRARLDSLESTVAALTAATRQGDRP